MDLQRREAQGRIDCPCEALSTCTFVDEGKQLVVSMMVCTSGGTPNLPNLNDGVVFQETAVPKIQTLYLDLLEIGRCSGGCTCRFLDRDCVAVEVSGSFGLR